MKTMLESPVLRPFGVDLFCLGKKFLVFNLVSRNIKTKYRRSVLGLFWTFLSPLAMAAVYYFVFKVVLRVQMEHYLIFILAGVLPWSFFSQTVLEGMESIVGNWGLVSKVPVPLQIFPYVGSLTNLVTLALATPILIGAALISGVSLGPSLVLLPAYFLALFLISYCFSLILAVAFVFFRDLRHLMGIILQLWFYGTPVIYDESMIPAKYHWVLYLNPVAYVFSALHKVLVKGEWPDFMTAGIVSFWTLLALAVALGVQKRFGRGLVENI